MAEFNRNEFGERLKKFRKEKGFSQENLARVIGKDIATISRFESGMLLPNAEEIYLLCNELEIDEYELFNSRDSLLSKKESKNPSENCGNNLLYFGKNKLFQYQ